MPKVVQETSQKDDRKLSPQEIKALKKNSVKARQRRKRLVCFLLVVVILLIAAIPGYRMLYQPYQADSVYRYMKTLYTMSGSGALPAEYNQALGALYDVNNDIGGWLIVPGSDINLPVVQTNTHDSVYYVNHLFDGTENPCGTPYYLNDPQIGRVGYNTVIRGGEQLMGELGGYRTLSFYQNAPVLFLDGLKDTVIYKVFAVVEVPDSQVSRFAEGSFATAADFHAFVTEMGERSLINTGVTVAKQDSLLTLLCDTEAGKLAIVARAVREGEDYTVDTSLATMNQGAVHTVTEWTVTDTDWQVTATDVVTATDAQ